MKREVISNQKIKSIGYGFYSSKLEIEFNNGEIIQIFKVPSEVFQSLKESKCCLDYYEKYIKGFFNSIVVDEKF